MCSGPVSWGLHNCAHMGDFLERLTELSKAIILTVMGVLRYFFFFFFAVKRFRLKSAKVTDTQSGI